MPQESSSFFGAILRLTRISPAWVGEMFRFLVVGVINTTVSYGAYLLLLQWFPYKVAYAISYILGIAISYLLSTFFVFRQPLRARAALRYPLVYLAQFLLGLVLLQVFVEFLGAPVWLAPLFVTALTIPCTFVMSRMIVRSG
jgi:putative flippase GtrA